MPNLVKAVRPWPETRDVALPRSSTNRHQIRAYSGAGPTLSNIAEGQPTKLRATVSRPSFSHKIPEQMHRRFRRWPPNLGSPMGFLMARRAEGDQILGNIISESAPRLYVMDLKAFHAPARLTAPSISLQDFVAELAIRFRFKPQAGPFREDPFQNVTRTSSRSCFLCGLGRPMTSRVRQGNKASRLPASKLTPARKSAQIISRQ